MTTDDGWMMYAACRGIVTEPDVFFPRKYKGVKTDYTRAKEICANCPVTKRCLGYAIAHSIYEGCWGGMSEGERKHLPSSTKIAIKKLWWKHYPESRPGRKVSKASA